MLKHTRPGRERSGPDATQRSALQRPVGVKQRKSRGRVISSTDRRRLFAPWNGLNAAHVIPAQGCPCCRNKMPCASFDRRPASLHQRCGPSLLRTSRARITAAYGVFFTLPRPRCLVPRDPFYVLSDKASPRINDRYRCASMPRPLAGSPRSPYKLRRTTVRN
jgi:hypothetical protein